MNAQLMVCLAQLRCKTSLPAVKLRADYVWGNFHSGISVFSLLTSAALTIFGRLGYCCLANPKELRSRHENCLFFAIFLSFNVAHLCMNFNWLLPWHYLWVMKPMLHLGTVTHPASRPLLIFWSSFRRLFQASALRFPDEVCSIYKGQDGKISNISFNKS